MQRSIRTFVAFAVLVSLTTGCLTPLVTQRWTGRDRTHAIGFRVDDASTLRWRVEGGHAEREGQLRIRDRDHDCEALAFFVYGEHGVAPLRTDAWTWAALEPGPVARYRVDRQAAECDLGIVVETVGAGRDPLLSLRLG